MEYKYFLENIAKWPRHYLDIILLEVDKNMKIIKINLIIFRKYKGIV